MSELSPDQTRLTANLSKEAVADSEDSLTQEGEMLSPSEGVKSSVSENATLLPATSTVSSSVLTEEIPGYVILKELGRGGMGVVYQARQIQLNRIVALKMILAGAHAGSDELIRFRTEAEAIARLQHPGIVQIYEIGDHQGLPFISLEFCSEGSLESRLNGTPMPPDEAAALVAQLAQAMHTVHEANVIHRDLKPANVLIDANGSHKITDFGLAKKLDEDSQTQTGAVMGSPSYMAPEQASGSTNQISPATDVYALGAILYECLTGRPPFKAASVMDTILQVINVETIPPGQLQPKVPKDLETVCLKCLQKDSHKRYATAKELEQDLQRFLNGEHILAHPISRIEKTWRWCKRNPGTALLSGTVILLLIAFALGSIFIAVDQTRQRKQAVIAQQKEETLRQRAEAAQHSLSEEKQKTLENLNQTRITLAHHEWESRVVTRTLTLLNRVPPESRNWEWHYLNELCEKEEYTLYGHKQVGKITYSPSGEKLASLGLQDGMIKIWDPQMGAELKTIQVNANDLAISPDETKLAVAVANVVILWNVSQERKGVRFVGHQHPVKAVFYVDEGQRLLTVDAHGVLKKWDVKSGKELQPIRWTIGIHHQISLSPNGKYLAAGGDDTQVKVWDVTTGEQILSGFGHLFRLGRLAFSPDSSLLASPGGEGRIKIWDLASRKQLMEFRAHESMINCVQFSRDGELLASGSADQSVRVWDRKTGKLLHDFIGHTGAISSVTFSPNGKYVSSASADGRIKIWSLESRTFVAKDAEEYFAKRKLNLSSGYKYSQTHATETYIGHVSPHYHVNFSPDGRYMITSSLGDAAQSGNPVAVWNLDTKKISFRLPIKAVGANRTAFSPDGKFIAVATGGFSKSIKGQLGIWDLKTKKQILSYQGADCIQPKITYSPCGRYLAFGMDSQSKSQLCIWNLSRNSKSDVKPARVISLNYPLASISFDSTGNHLLLLDASGKINIHQSNNLKAIRQIACNSIGGLHLACGPESTVAVAFHNGTINIWNWQTGNQLLAWEGHAGSVNGICWSPNGSRIVTCADDRTVKIWDVIDGSELLAFKEHRLPVMGVTWSPDGNRIASAGMDGVVKAWKIQRLAMPPDTSNWEILYKDNFNKGKLGTNWQGYPKAWSLEEGVLSGILSPLKVGNLAPFNYTQITLTNCKLPKFVEIELDYWISAPMNCGITLHNPKTGKQIVANCSGSITAYGFHGALATLLQILPQGIPPTTILGTPNKQIFFEVDKRYHLRVLRTSNRLRLYVDNKEVLSVKIPSMEAPLLVLAGSWGSKDDRIFVDNLTIRAPKGRDQLLSE